MAQKCTWKIKSYFEPAFCELVPCYLWTPSVCYLGLVSPPGTPRCSVPILFSLHPLFHPPAVTGCSGMKPKLNYLPFFLLLVLFFFLISELPCTACWRETVFLATSCVLTCYSVADPHHASSPWEPKNVGLSTLPTLYIPQVRQVHCRVWSSAGYWTLLISCLGEKRKQKCKNVPSHRLPTLGPPKHGYNIPMPILRHSGPGTHS